MRTVRPRSQYPEIRGGSAAADQGRFGAVAPALGPKPATPAVGC